MYKGLEHNKRYKMKIIEALKELPLIEKKVKSNIASISKYAALASNEEPPFTDAKTQRAKISAWIQANEDLSANYENIRNRLAKTNSNSVVDINGKKKTINEWLSYRNVTSGFAEGTYLSLSPENTLKNSKITGDDALEGYAVQRMYNEEDKLKALEDIMETRERIDAALEMHNAITDLAA